MATATTNPLLDKAAKIRDALRKIDESTGLRTLWTADTHSEVSEFFGVSTDTVAVWSKKGCKFLKRGDKRLDMIAQWLRTEGPWQDRYSGGMTGDTIDDKARKLRAEADIKEMEAEAKAGTLVPLDMVEQTLNRMADALKQLGEDFGRMSLPISGRDAQKKVNDMLDSIEWET